MKNSPVPYTSYYNFCRVYKSLLVAPVMEAGITDHYMDAAGFAGAGRMTKERENEIRQMTRKEQEGLLFKLRQKYSAQRLLPGQPTPMHNARDRVAADEEIELLEELQRDSE